MLVYCRKEVIAAHREISLDVNKLAKEKKITRVNFLRSIPT